MPSPWIQAAIKRPGAFTAKARRAGWKDVQAFARYVKAHPERYGETTRRQANLATTLGKMAKRRSKK